MTNKEAGDIILELHDSDKYSIADITEAKRMAIKALEQEPKWIFCSERLPEPFQDILVTSEDFHWANEPVSYSVKQECFGGSVNFIAWMPLPEPCKVESEVKRC